MAGTELLIFYIWLFLHTFPHDLHAQGQLQSKGLVQMMGDTLIRLHSEERLLTWSTGIYAYRVLHLDLNIQKIMF